MKIIISTFTYYPNLDGVQKVTQYQAEGLAQLGHDVSVLTIGEGGKTFELYNLVKIYRVKVFFKFGFYLKGLKTYQNKLLDLIKDADVLIIIGSIGLVSKVINKIKCKKVLYLHGKPAKKISVSVFNFGFSNGLNMIYKIVKSNLYYFFNWVTLKKFDLVTHLFQNDETYKYFEEKKYSKNLVLENAADNMFFEGYSVKYNTNSIKRNIISIGNYHPRKNQIYTLEAFYKSDNKNLTLNFFGSQKNNYYYKLLKANKRFEKTYGKTNVNFHVNLTRLEMLEYFKESLCFLLSSYDEYYPMVIVESLALGIPFISTDVGIINKLPGGVVVKSKEAMSYWINFFVKNKEIAELYGLIGHNYADKNLRVQKQVNKLNDSLNNLINYGK